MVLGYGMQPNKLILAIRVLRERPKHAYSVTHRPLLRLATGGT
jgi:hypothetical protein